MVISTNNQNVDVFLYQWVDFNKDYEDVRNLGRLGGSRQAASRLRDIERDAIDHPNRPQWIIAARRKNSIWGVVAILRVRPPSVEDSRLQGNQEKYIYFDTEQSIILTTPTDKPIINDAVNKSLNNIISENTRGENGKKFSLPVTVLNNLISMGVLTLKARVEELRANFISQQVSNFPEPMSDKPSIDVIIPIPSYDLNNTEDTLLSDFEAASKNLESEFPGIGEDVDAIAKRRLGQGPFRRLLERQYGVQCVISGMTMRELLIASHIIPWSKSEPNEKIDPNNGLLLSVNWDSVFDKGFISFDDNGEIIVSKYLDDESAVTLGIRKDARLPEYVFKTRRQYLQYHREKIFERFLKVA